MTTPTTPAAAVSLDDLAGQLLECIADTPWLTCNVAKSVVRSAAEELRIATARESALIAERDALQASHQPLDGRPVYARFTAWASRQGFTQADLDGPLHELQGAFEAGAAHPDRQTETQQGGGENTARAFIEWCKAQPEDRVPVSIDEALNEFEAALATKERS